MLLKYKILPSKIILLMGIIIVQNYIFSQEQFGINPDSIIYVRSGNITTITTFRDYQKKDTLKDKRSKLNLPTTPIKLSIDSASQIEFSIYDSTSTVVKYFEFNAAKSGEYLINVWAFYENLPQGEYTCLIKYPGKLIKQKFVIVE